MECHYDTLRQRLADFAGKFLSFSQIGCFLLSVQKVVCCQVQSVHLPYNVILILSPFTLFSRRNFPHVESEGMASMRRKPHPAAGAGGVGEIRAALNKGV